MQLAKPLTLASGSAVRADLLRRAGLSFDVKISGVDEAALKQDHQDNAAGLALALAAAKAKAIHAEGLVIGADQLLECDGRLFDKPGDIAAARTNLQFFRGKTHILVAGVVLVEKGAVVWQHGERAVLTMRDFSDAFLDVYLSEIGNKALASVGCYQLEGVGAHLFERIDGDYFSILGLPLLPLLQALREHDGLCV